MTAAILNSGKNNSDIDYSNHLSGPTSNVRQKNYALDRNKTIAKKVDACDRSIQFIDRNNGNYVITMNTAGFEVFRNKLLSNIHLPSGTRLASRHIEYNIDQDTTGLIVIDTIKIKSWNALKDPISQGKRGSLSVTINLYRTQCKAVINGTDYRQLGGYIYDLVESIKFNNEIQLTNKRIKTNLSKLTSPKHTSTSVVYDSAKNRTNQAVLKPADEKTSFKKASKTNKTQSTSCDLHCYNQPVPTSSTAAFMLDYENDKRDDFQDIQDICPTCNTTVMQEGVLCDSCETWLHYQCENLSNDTILSLEERSDLKYTCHSCKTLNNTNTIIEDKPIPASTSKLNNPITPQITTHAVDKTQRSQHTMCTTTLSFTSISQRPVTSPYVLPGSVSSHIPYVNPPQHLASFCTTPPRLMSIMPSLTPMATIPSPTLIDTPRSNNTHAEAHTNIIQQLDILKTENNRLKEENKLLDTQCDSLKKQAEKEIQEAQEVKKKSLNREKVLKTREAAISAREINQKERDEQITLLKTYVNELETRTKELDEQNKLWKLKFLTSEELRNNNNQQSPQNSPNNCFCNTQGCKSVSYNCHNSLNVQNSPNNCFCNTQGCKSVNYNCHNSIDVPLKIIELLTIATQRSSEPTKITNVYQPGKPFHNNRRRPHFKTNHHRYRQQYTKPCQVYEYNHGHWTEQDYNNSSRHDHNSTTSRTSPSTTVDNDGNDVNTTTIISADHTIAPTNVQQSAATTQSSTTSTHAAENFHIDLTGKQDENSNTANSHDNVAEKVNSPAVLPTLSSDDNCDIICSPITHNGRANQCKISNSTSLSTTSRDRKQSFLDVVHVNKPPDPRNYSSQH